MCLDVTVYHAAVIYHEYPFRQSGMLQLLMLRIRRSHV